MSEIRVNKIQGTSGTDTAITLSGANATVGGTLAVTGVHTIGTNAVVTAEGGSATSVLASGLVKAWNRTQNGSTVNQDSFNMSSVTDSGAGDFRPQINNNMNNATYIVVSCGDDKQDGGRTFAHNINQAVATATTGYGMSFKGVGSSYAQTDPNDHASSAVLGDLA
jgi:hypothetical protein